MSRLNNHVFISFFNGSFLCLIFQAFWPYCQEQMLIVLLASMLNSILVLLEKLSQYLATVIIRSVFRIYETWWNFLSKYVTAFTSIIPFWQGHEFASDHDTVFSSNQNSLQILVFLENCNKKGDISYDFTFS